MNYRYFLCAFLAACALCACGKTNPDKPTPDPPKDLPDVILSQDFTKGLGAFTVQDKDKGGFSGKIWRYETEDAKTRSYGAQASAYDGSTKYAVESWLISPEIDLTNYTDANLYFNHAFDRAYDKTSGKGTNLADHFSIRVSEDGGTTWKPRAIPLWRVTHSYFELAQSGNISLGEFKGKKIIFAFVYKSTKEFAPHWEITDVTVSYDRMVPVPDDNGEQFKSVAKGMMEMPLIKDEANFYAHTTILRFDRVRNYAFSYNPDAHVSDWVAYPLYEKFTKNRVPRYDAVVSTEKAWAVDPYVATTNVASGRYYEWSAKGYSRGHQLPSADRLGGAMANIQTFYTSNVAPQDSKFNGGIWEKLESAVRGLVPSEKDEPKDTLYVVTGCVTDATCSKVKDHTGTEVAVPKAYYKALLRLKGGTYLGAGFYLEHKAEIADGNYMDYAMSLKDLEAKTGMTFFVNLPADKAAAIKAENSINSMKNSK